MPIFAIFPSSIKISALYLSDAVTIVPFLMIFFIYVRPFRFTSLSCMKVAEWQLGAHSMSSMFHQEPRSYRSLHQLDRRFDKGYSLRNLLRALQGICFRLQL